MKKFFTFAVSALMASAAWAGVVSLDLNKPINPEALEYNDYGIWTQCYNDVDYTWLEFGDENGEFMFSHLIDGEGASWGGYYWDGFCPAIGGDITDYGEPGSSGSWTTNFGGCMASGGCVINEDGSVTADPDQPYLVAYYSSWAMEGPSNQIMFVDKDGNMAFEPVGVYVCNHPWPYYGCEHGDGFGRPFAEGDYFELTAHGVAAGGGETTVSMNLVEFTNGELKAANDWTFFDLSALGEVVSVYFTLNSTDSGEWGMNTAAYFCMDKFQVKGEGGEEPEMEQTAVPAFKEYTEEGVEGVFLEIVEAEPSTIFYRIETDDRSWTGWMEYTQALRFTGEGTYCIEAYAVAPEKLPSDVVSYDLDLSSVISGINELANGKAVTAVRYFNLAGQEIQQPAGITIKVITYTDGTTSAAKIVK